MSDRLAAQQPRWRVLCFELQSERNLEKFQALLEELDAILRANEESADRGDLLRAA